MLKTIALQIKKNDSLSTQTDRVGIKIGLERENQQILGREEGKWSSKDDLIAQINI